MSDAPRSLVTVDLEAIRANVRALLRALAPGVSLCAVVKADAYGHGAPEVGRAAIEAGASMLAVVTAGEAVLLRERGYRGRLLVMGPVFDPAEAADLSARGADLTLVSLEMLPLLQSLPQDRGHRLQLKVDSGMFRQGVLPSSLPQVLEEISQHPHLELSGIMTHLACADEDPSCVEEQLLEFTQAVELARRFAPGILVHAANSAATLRYPRSHFGMARCGIALYGLSPFQGDPKNDGLKPALTWTSTVASLKELARGRAAGYGHTFRTEEGTRLALVPLGYADGLRRDLGNRGQVLIGGHRYPIAGRVSMDSFLVDVGRESPVKAGDRVTIVGTDGEERLTFEDQARLLGTINYELSCAISLRRAERRFTG